MNSKKKNIEAQIVEDFEKIRPAITRLLQTQMKNDDLSLRYGRSRSNSKNDIVINPSILVNTISKTNLDRDEVMIGTVVHEAIHASNNYFVDSESLNDLFPDELDDVEDVDDVLEILTGPFGKYVFDILIHSIEEKIFVKQYEGLNSILEDIYTESFSEIKKLGNFSQYLSLLFHSITSYIDVKFEIYKKPVVSSLNESLHILKTLNYEDVNVSQLIEATVQMVDICKRYNILPDLDNYTLGEQKEIEEETGCSVEIDDDGILTLGSTEEDAILAGKEMVMLIIDPPEAEVGAQYDGEVVSVATYGAFVNILPGRDGLLHVSKFHSSKRVNNTEAVVSVGDKIKVNVDSIENGKVSLSPVEDLEIPEEAEGAESKNSRDRKSTRNKNGNRNGRDKKRGNEGKSSNRKRVSFEDEFEKGL